MSRTYRNCPDRFLRRPSGRKQALIKGMRHKALPPDAWDDLPISGQYEAKYQKKNR